MHQPHAYIEPTIPMANAAIARPQEEKQEGKFRQNVNNILRIMTFCNKEASRSF
jgi:hypothetical protein